MATYDLEESIRIQGGPRLEMLPLVRKAIEMMLHDEKGRALEYLKMANQVERLYQEVPDLYEAVLTSSFGPQPFHGLLDGDDDEDDQDRRSCSREETCDEEQGFEERYQDQHAYGRCEDRCKLDKRETCDEEHDLEGRDCDCHHEDHCKLKRRERCDEERYGREETCNEESYMSELVTLCFHYFALCTSLGSGSRIPIIDSFVVHILKNNKDV